MKKAISVLLTLCMLISVFTYSFNLSVNAVSINDGEVFVKQSQSGRCTLASAVMMLRRRAIIDGVSGWEEMCEDTVGVTAWTSAGLYNNFAFGDMIVGYSELFGTPEEKKALLISLLDVHPEGIQVYNRDAEKRHAVLVTDYDVELDTFFCADPANGIECGRIPLTLAWLPGESQDERIENLDAYWYISNRSGGTVENFYSNKIISNVNVPLKNGDVNTSVKELQIALNKVAEAGLDVDGHFGQLTETAVSEFQTQYELVVDGIAGKDTLELLNELYGEHTHLFVSGYEELHPHKGYRVCDCGLLMYNGLNNEVETCTECVVPENNVIVFTIGETKVNVFGTETECDVAPQIVNDRTMLPVRFLAENLGASIAWVPGESGVVTITKDDKSINLSIGAECASVNGEDVSLDSPAYIDNDRVYLPVRFLAEVFDAEVSWDSETKQVIITKK